MTEHAAQRPFTLMAKPTCGTCNLACTYCYYLDKTALYPGRRRPRMTGPVLEAYTARYLAAAPPGEVLFTWQGGEPLLAGKEFFRRALALQRKHRTPGRRPVNILQTNATLVDGEWAELFREHDFLLGVSLDGPREVHDRYRRSPAGEGSFDRAWRGFERLREKGVRCNVLATLHAANVSLGAELYRFFRDRDIAWLQFIPILERDEAGRPLPFSCPPDAYGRFLCGTFDAWHPGDVGRVSVRLFESVLHSLVLGRASLCTFARRCADAHVLEWNGDLYACDHFVERRWRLGNILEEPLEELRRGSLLREFAALKSDPPGACAACPWLELCRGGCPKHHDRLGEGERRNHFCSAYRRFFAHAGEGLGALAREIAAPPEPAPRPRRNAPCPCGSGRKFKHCCGGDG